MKRGRLIAFEGLDGAGKSTQMGLLAEALRAAGCDAIETREPTDGANGRRIRELARSGQEIAAEEELRLFVADRREHVQQVIAPALAAGRVVLTDRYFLSTVAYQGARGLDPEELLAQAEAEFPLPDLVLLLEIDADAGLARAAARGRPHEGAFEQRERLERVARIFAGLERPYLARLDASAPAEAVARAIAARVKERLALP